MILCPPDPLNLMSLIKANQFWAGSIEIDILFEGKLLRLKSGNIICCIYWPFYTETATFSGFWKMNTIPFKILTVTREQEGEDDRRVRRVQCR